MKNSSAVVSIECSVINFGGKEIRIKEQIEHVSMVSKIIEHFEIKSVN